MAHVIAVAGKGGVGKTTLCGMLIQYLCEKGKGPILAVDADANSNLNEVLGVKVETTLGDVREEIARAELAKENPIPTGMSKADYAEMRFEDALVEDDDFDLLVMGRTQGKGCYCYVNGLLQTQLAKYQNNYPYIVVDNEAGMEHISRGVLPSMQTAILVSDCSRRGVQAVGRIAELIKECDMHPDTVGLIINRAPKGELNKGIQELNSHTMSTDFSDYRISVFYCMFMNCTSHISDRSPWFHLGNTNLNTFFCDLDKFFLLRTHFTDAEHSGRVRIITIIYCRYINIDNISLFQNLLFIRDSMAYHFIYRSTHALWKSFVI